MELIEKLIAKAKEKNCCIVLPEGNDKRVTDAAKSIARQGIARIIVLSEAGKPVADEGELKSLGVTILDYQNSPDFGNYAAKLYEMRKQKGVTPEKAQKMLMDPMYYGCMMVNEGAADGMVAGACHSTGDTLRPALQIVKTAPGTKTVSSYMLMDVPSCNYGDNGIFVFSDCGLVEFPSADQLADIAVESAKSFEKMTGGEPIVAMLSYSTKGSAKNERLGYVIEAARKVKERYPNLKCDGELQLDAALDMTVGRLKAKGSPVAGNANVLIFPDLNAGNIGYKLVQRLGRAQAYGPVTQGLRKPVNDLSRGCVADDIVGVVALTCLQVEK